MKSRAKSRAKSRQCKRTFKRAQAGLPDGIFPYQNLQFWFILRGIGMENFEMVYKLCLGIFFKCQFKNKIHQKEIKK